MTKQAFKKFELNYDISKTYKRLSRRKFWVVVYAFIITIITAFFNLALGQSDVYPMQLLFDAFNNQTSTSAIIIWNLRMPHVLCSLIAGATLGICGCILQSSLTNPLASPSTIGVSQGASCGACIAIVLFGHTFIGDKLFIVAFAFIFAIFPTLIILLLSKKNKLSPTSIILTGIAMSIFFAGLISIIEYFADSSKVAEVVFWTFGSVQDKNYNEIIIMAITLSIIFIYALINYLNFNALECGDSTAHSIGINTSKTRFIHLMMSALCSSCITAFCGTINFIGLISPHIMRKFSGANYKYLIPASAFCGGSLLSLSDILSSALIPGVILPIGAITSIIGAPIFVLILIKKVK